ncbi:hypothetical protein PAPHI01_1719 [Pancytospora philotis]|nr:hypothetical protein PAPHI01_1719 [Pancytospora philotis]
MAISFQAASAVSQIASFIILGVLMHYLSFWPTAQIIAAWALFLLSLAARFGIAFYIRRQINTKNDQTHLKCNATKSVFAGWKSYIFDGTVCEYDRRENDMYMHQVYAQLVTILFSSNTNIVKCYSILYASNLLCNLLTSPVYRAHLYGLPVDRPFEMSNSAPFTFPFFVPRAPVAAQTGTRKIKKE